MLENKLYKNLANFIASHPQPHFLLALSGGPDSVALLHCLKKLRNKLQFNLSCAHINHQLRGEEAIKDSEFCADLCKNYAIPFFYNTAPVAEYAKEHKLSIEEAARIIRYQLLAEIASTNNSTILITGHHSDDNTETILARLITSTSISALKGMEMESRLFCAHDLTIFRPMLTIWHWEIIKYIQDNNLPFCLDSTNTDSDFQRNRIRNKLIPLLESKYNQGIKNTLIELAKNIKEDDQFINSAVEKYYKAIKLSGDTITFSTSELPQEAPLLKRLLLFASRKLKAQDDIFTSQTLNKITELIFSEKASFSINLKCDYTAQKQGRILTLTKKTDQEKEFTISIPGPGEFDISAIAKKITLQILESVQSAYLLKNKNPIYVDAALIKFPITVRSKRAGDNFTPFGGLNEKKLKDYFIDKKIPRFDRWKIPVVTDAAGLIIWIAEHQINNSVKITNQTTRILKIYIS